MRRIILLTKTIFCAIALLVLSAGCADETFPEPNSKETETSKERATSVITIDNGSAGVSLPQSTASTRAAVTMNEMFQLTEDNDFETDAYLIKEDDDESINDKRKLAYLHIRWKNKTKTADGWSLSTYEPSITLEWINKKAVDIMPGENWYVAGIVGGDMERSKGIPNTVEFYGQEGKKPKVMNASVAGSDSKHKFNVPFVANWVKVGIKEKNKIEFQNMHFEPQGVVFKVKVKRNEKLLKPEEHEYMFSSTGLSPNVFFSFVDYDKGIDPRQSHNVRVSHRNPVKDYWVWHYPTDQRDLGDGTDKQTNKAWAAANKIYQISHTTELRYRYTYPASKSTNKDYDVFYVWGMPINGGEFIEYKSYTGTGNRNKAVLDPSKAKFELGNTTAITSAHGGFMLGWLNGQGKVRGEFLCGTPHTNEFQRIDDWSPYMGKIMDVNLKVMRPGDKRYKWRVPLARMAKSNLARPERVYNEIPVQELQFTNSLIPHNDKGKFDQKHLQILVEAGKAPEGYHIPTVQELGAALPYATSQCDPDWTENQKDLEGSNLGFKKDGLGPQLDGYFKEWLQLKDLQGFSAPSLYNSIYKTVIDGNSKVIYAIRFKHVRNTDNKDLTGNRYRCAYRFVIHTEDKNKGCNVDGRGRRLAITARWIGNLPITIDEISNPEYWNKNNTNDVVRILNDDGEAKGLKIEDDACYFSATKKREGDLYDQGDPNKVYFYQYFHPNGFYRGNMTKGYAVRGSIRCFANWDLSESAPNAPRQQRITGAHNEEYYK
ncbi:hypothetical protein ABVC73_15350 [Prevotella melaninogenica]